MRTLQEIDQELERTRQKTERLRKLDVILEDLDLHKLRLKPHHIQTDPCIGLTEEDVERAVSILGEK